MIERDGREFRHSVEKLKKFWFELAAKIIRLLGRIMVREVCARINGEWIGKKMKKSVTESGVWTREWTVYRCRMLASKI